MDDNLKNKHYHKSFEEFLEALRTGNTSTWTQLVTTLRSVTMPWLLKRIGTLPTYSLISSQELANEVFAESLAKFYNIFPTGTFHKHQDLQSLLFKIADLKLKESFARLKKDQQILRLSTYPNLEEISKLEEVDQDEIEQKKLVYQYLLSLPTEERTLLQRYYWGERLKDIAEDMGISEVNCRKKKQRALAKLKHKFFGFSHRNWNG